MAAEDGLQTQKTLAQDTALGLLLLLFQGVLDVTNDVPYCYLLNYESEPVKLIIKFNVQADNILLYTSSIRLSFQPSNCMIILCSCVPWRKASTLVASA